MHLIGTIVKLQVQRASLKVGQSPRRRYDPAPLTDVPSLTLDVGGVNGWSAAGEQIADVHHAAHPQSKNRGENGVSVGFTAHYDAMREHFGLHLTDGIAGENILVAAEDMFGEDDLRHGLAIETKNGALVRLGEVIIATPCVEFTRYALRFPDDARPDATVTEALQFLNDGMRGYYAALHGPPARIALGNRVFVCFEE
ncbi:MAG: hypothetical protein ACRDJW_11005 [Thermomicrobiales bacterium]